MPGRARLGDGMGSFGKLKTITELPPKRQFLAWIRKPAKLNEQGVKTPAYARPGG